MNSENTHTLNIREHQSAWIMLCNRKKVKLSAERSKKLSYNAQNLTSIMRKICPNMLKLELNHVICSTKARQCNTSAPSPYLKSVLPLSPELYPSENQMLMHSTSVMIVRVELSMKLLPRHTIATRLNTRERGGAFADCANLRRICMN